MEGLILAGGKSQRMNGIHKGNLVYNRQTFLEHIVEEFAKETDRILVSCGIGDLRKGEKWNMVSDIFPECGPIGGLHAGLLACGSEWVMVAACDMPCLKIELYQYMREIWQQAEKEGTTYDGVVPAVEGRVHPLAAIYRKETACVFEEQIKSGNYRMTDGIKRLNMLCIDITLEQEFRKMLSNINTRADYEALLQRAGQEKGDRKT